MGSRAIVGTRAGCRLASRGVCHDLPAVTRRAFLLHFGGILLGWMLLAPLAQGAADPEVVREAIARKRSLRFTYAGHVRFVEPHVLGQSPGGHRAVLAWQFDGGSRSKQATGWRTFLLSEISDLQVTVRGFTPRPGIERERAALRSVEFEVTPPPPPQDAR